MESTVVLKRGREKPVLNHHPWIFGGAVHRVEGEPEGGDLVRVVNSRGQFLATGTINLYSQIAVRLLTWDPGEEVDAAFWQRRLARAITSRARLASDPETTAYRLVHAEADGLPGLVVDRYGDRRGGDWLVLQCLTLGMARRRDEIVDLLADPATFREIGQPAPDGLYARDDAEVRRKEGLPLETGLLWGREPPERIEILEHGRRFLVDVRQGHKTGFYLDQRENRLRAAALCAGADVLNAFAYTGAFGVYAALAGARSVTHIDTSAEALALAGENLTLNDCRPPEGGDHELPAPLAAPVSGASCWGQGREYTHLPTQHEMVVGDVFQVLRDYRDRARTFDLVILDPPKFATSQAQVQAASRGYKDINLLALKLLRPGGFLVTFSCSGLVSADLFQKIVYGASVDAGRDVQIVERLAQGPDHPVLLTFSESDYLKGFICRVW